MRFRVVLVWWSRATTIAIHVSIRFTPLANIAAQFYIGMILIRRRAMTDIAADALMIIAVCVTVAAIHTGIAICGLPIMVVFALIATARMTNGKRANLIYPILTSI
jgi:hypothetical protein